MAPAPTSTIIITGANGALGSKIALEICRGQPGKHHLVLTARNTSDQTSLQATTELQNLSPGPASFSWSTLDLASLDDVRLFAADIKRRIRSGDIPPLNGGGGGIVNSAAVFSYATGDAGRTRYEDGGLDVDYGVNVLAPMLLVTELLEVLRGGVAVVVNLASISHGSGTVDWFHPAPGRGAEEVKDGENEEGRTLGVAEAFRRYGSSKLLLTMMGYALQRRLDAVSFLSPPKLSRSEKKFKDCTAAKKDYAGEGGVGYPDRSARSWRHVRPVAHGRWRTLAVQDLEGGLHRPWDRCCGRVQKSAINPPVVPARIIAGMFEKSEGTAGLAGKYFVLDDELKSSVASLDVEVQERVWQRAMDELRVDPLT